MDDLISRQELLKKSVPVKGYFTNMVTAWDIAHAPSVEAEPVRHGRWEARYVYIYNSDDEPVAVIGRKYKCSECGRMEDQKEQYCNCGAKMDAEESK